MRRDWGAPAGGCGGPRKLLPLLLLLIAILTTGCAGRRDATPPLEPPAVSPAISYRPGGPSAMPTTLPAGAVAAGDALAVRTTWVALARLPRPLRPILSDATLITAPRSADPFLAAGRLSRGAGIVPTAQVEAFLADVEGGRFGQRAAIAASDGALPTGVTTTFALGDAAQRIEVSLHRPGAAAMAAATMPADAIELSLTIDVADAQRERVLLAAQAMPPPARFALVLPVDFEAPRVKAIVAVVELAPPSDSPEHRQAVLACEEALRRFAAGPGPEQAPPAVASGWAGVTTALQAMDQPGTSRVAMVYLARETGAELFGDVALVAPDPTLADLAARVRTHFSDSPTPVESAQLGWQFDVVTLGQLAELQASEKLPPELAGVLARYAGEAARNAGSLEELTRVTGRDALQSRLIAENFTYLEDASPSARVRAYDWLNSRGRAPANYDPLGAPRERSAAIDAALTAAAAPAAAATAPAAQTIKTTGGVP